MRSLTDWADAGAHWRVLRLEPERALVELCTCLGEPEARVTTEDPEVIAFLRGRPTA